MRCPTLAVHPSVLCAALCVACCQPGAPAHASPQAGLAAWYSFDLKADPAKDSSAYHHDAEVSAGTPVTGREGLGLSLDGREGLSVASTSLLQSHRGFTLDCWVMFTSTEQNMNIISKEGEYLLRVDPAAEGSSISFFVDVGGSLEPRVRGPVASPGVWYHLIAAWDGEYATLWVNSERYRSRRPGAISPTDAPVLIGRPGKWGTTGVKGIMDEVRLLSRALTAGDVLVAEYVLDQRPSGPGVRTARFEFDDGPGGWETRGVDGVRTRHGVIRGRFRGHGSALLHRHLNVPVAHRPFVALRMAVDKGSAGSVVFLTTGGAQAVTFPLNADGQMHSYVLRLDDDPEWDGRLLALGVAPSEVSTRASVDFIRVCAKPKAPPEVQVESLLASDVLPRAQRPCRITAVLRNTGGDGRNLVATLAVPEGVSLAPNSRRRTAQIGHGQATELSWEVIAEQAVPADIRLEVEGKAMTPATAIVRVRFDLPLDLPKADYVPEMRIAHSDVLVGAHYCPLWKQGSRSSGWELIVPFPEREPALGWYDEDDPEVTDWEIKWALEHGISFFVYCWYRKSQGRPVETFLSHAIHDGLFNSRYGSKFKFCIMWENQQKGISGVASEQDLLQNLLPFWIETYFKHPSYLKVDNKPLLFVYRPEYLVQDLGGIANVRAALQKMRETCRQAGFDGLTLLGEYRGTQSAPLQLMADEGLDYTFAYCWPAPGNPSPAEAIRAQESAWRKTEGLGIIPQVITLSMGWDSTPWHASSSIWRLPPDDFKTLCKRGKAMMSTLPSDSLGSKMVLLDNWNEFGEGHYIAPHRQYGFAYLDAVREVFTNAPEPHVDIVPEDVGLGPYEKGFGRYTERREMCRKPVTAKRGAAPGLVGWWTFDEPEGTPCAWDYSGHRRGGFLTDATRVEGFRGRGLLCNGGSVTVPSDETRYPSREMTVECWIKTDTPGQHNKWFVNKIHGTGNSGFRLGLLEGKLCWAVSKTAWSHHLVDTEPVPLGEWVHVAATCDGKTMRLYVNGEERVSMPRTGRILSNRHALTLGNYQKGHRAFFTGLLDDVRIYGRALPPEEIRRHAQR